MKITKDRLKKIIAEEIDNMQDPEASLRMALAQIENSIAQATGEAESLLQAAENSDMKGRFQRIAQSLKSMNNILINIAQ